MNKAFWQEAMRGKVCTLLRMWSPMILYELHYMSEGQGHGEEHKNPIPAVDFLISKENKSKILLVRRKNDPFKGMLSIPGVL